VARLGNGRFGDGILSGARSFFQLQTRPDYLLCPTSIQFKGYGVYIHFIFFIFPRNVPSYTGLSTADCAIGLFQPHISTEHYSHIQGATNAADRYSMRMDMPLQSNFRHVNLPVPFNDLASHFDLEYINKSTSSLTHLLVILQR
jgi:hypothetical protein